MCKRRPNVPLSKDIQLSKRYNADASRAQTNKELFWKRKSLEDRLMRKLQCKTEVYDESQQKKDKLFHKKIRQYRSLIEEQHDTHVLEFILSLRKTQDKLPGLKKQLPIEPFQVSQKLTSNQKVKKNISDINSGIDRIFDASYRWKRCNGTDARVGCDFECSLRKNSLTQSSSIIRVLKAFYDL